MIPSNLKDRLMVKSVELFGGNGEGVFVYVSDEDEDLLTKYKWYLSHGYATTNMHVKGKGRKHMQRNLSLSLHRLVGERMGDILGKLIDHKNRNRLDCTRENLRITGYKGNAANTSIQTRALPKGVSPERGADTFSVRVAKQHYGSYPSAELAGRVYDKIARSIWGNFSVLNYPEFEELPDTFSIVNWNTEPREAKYRSKEVGVSWFSPRKRWRYIHKKKTYGYFDTEKEAIEFKRKLLNEGTIR